MAKVTAVVLITTELDDIQATLDDMVSDVECMDGEAKVKVVRIVTEDELKDTKIIFGDCCG